MSEDRDVLEEIKNQLGDLPLQLALLMREGRSRRFASAPAETPPGSADDNDVSQRYASGLHADAMRAEGRDPEGRFLPPSPGQRLLNAAVPFVPGLGDLMMKVRQFQELMEAFGEFRKSFQSGAQPPPLPPHAQVIETFAAQPLHAPTPPPLPPLPALPVSPALSQRPYRVAAPEEEPSEAERAAETEVRERYRQARLARQHTALPVQPPTYTPPDLPAPPSNPALAEKPLPVHPTKFIPPELPTPPSKPAMREAPLALKPDKDEKRRRRERQRSAPPLEPPRSSDRPPPLEPPRSSDRPPPLEPLGRGVPQGWQGMRPLADLSVLSGWQAAPGSLGGTPELLQELVRLGERIADKLDEEDEDDSGGGNPSGAKHDEEPELARPALQTETKEAEESPHKPAVFPGRPEKKPAPVGGHGGGLLRAGLRLLVEGMME